jgi:hypothetical protein
MTNDQTMINKLEAHPITARSLADISALKGFEQHYQTRSPDKLK